MDFLNSYLISNYINLVHFHHSQDQSIILELTLIVRIIITTTAIITHLFYNNHF